MTPVSDSEKALADVCGYPSPFLGWLKESGYAVIGSLTGVKAQEAEKVQGMQRNVQPLEHNAKDLLQTLVCNGVGAAGEGEEDKKGGQGVAGGDKAKEGED